MKRARVNRGAGFAEGTRFGTKVSSDVGVAFAIRPSMSCQFTGSGINGANLVANLVPNLVVIKVITLSSILS